MKKVLTLAILTAVTVISTGCNGWGGCCDRDPCCRPRCCKPTCCGDRGSYDRGNYERPVYERQGCCN